MKSVMQHQFAQTPRVNIPRTSHNRSCGYKTAFNSGYLIPFFVDEALPGDTFKLKFNHLTRLITPIVPVMDNIYIDTFWYAVPKRLVWDHWENFCGERKTPDDTTEYVVPQIEAPEGGFAVESIFDYMGIRPKIGNISVNALIPRCYNLIYNEWFRDQNLQDPVPVHTDDGPDPAEDYVLLKRGKRKDYFTSCLPWPQKGVGVEIPLGTTAPVIGNGMCIGVTNGTLNGGLKSLASGSTYAISPQVGLYGGNVGENATSSQYINGGIGVTEDPEKSGMIADLTSASAATINTLRQAFQIQRMMEIDAIGGTRYAEILLSHFGVVSPDARLQRPEYLGGTHHSINAYPVAQTSATDTITPQGNLSAYALGRGSDDLCIDKSFVEHCYVIGIVNVRCDLTYQQGLDKIWSRKTRYDFFWPALGHLGEQAVLNKEIFLQGNEQDDEVFGYQERFAEYRFKNSLVTGKMRSDDEQSLDVWHLSQNFESLPVLNGEFIEDNPPIKRIVAIQDEPEFHADFYLEYYCYRPIPLYGTPLSLGGRF